MQPIQPLHTCYWSHHRRTVVRLTAEGYHASGMSLPVVMSAFTDEPLCWYSRYYGDVHGGQHENLRLVAVSLDRIGLPRTLYATHPGPLTSLPDTLFAQPEYLLDDATCAALKLAGEDDRFTPTDGQSIACAVHLHDDCFARVEPTPPERLRALLHGILRLHSFYLGQTIDWANVLDDVQALLTSQNALDIQSDPATHCLCLDNENAANRRPHGLHTLPPLAQISVENHMATFKRG